MEIKHAILTVFLMYYASLLLLAARWSKSKPVWRGIMIALPILLGIATACITWRSLCAGL
jgi:hypothetical protein